MGRDNQQGTSGRGRGRNSGRGGRQGRGNYSRNSKKSSDNKKEVKFYPHGSGSQYQSVTFDTVKDHIVQLVQRTYRNGIDIAKSLEKEVKVDLSTEEPQRLISSEADEKKKSLEQDGFDMKYKILIEAHYKRVLQLDENLTKAYSLIYASFCNRTIQVRIEEHQDFESKIKNDPIELLKAIRVLMHDPARAKYPYASLTESLLRVLQYTKQAKDEGLVDYVTRFKSAKNVLKSHAGSNVLDAFIENTEEYRKASATTQAELKKEAFDRWMAYTLIKNSDQEKYGSLINGLQSQFSLNNNQYPKTIVHATDILANHRHDNSQKKRGAKKDDKNKDEKDGDNKDETPKERSFAQDDVVCFCCGKDGHKSNECKDKDKIPKAEWFINKAKQQHHMKNGSDNDEESTGNNEGQSTRSNRSQDSGWSGLHISMQQGSNYQDYRSDKKITDMKKKIMLDNGSTIDLFANEDLVTGIRKSKKKMLLATNAGTKLHDMTATVPGFGEVWFDKDAIANIFGLSSLKKRHRITYDSDKEDAFLVYTDNGICKFECTPDGLYMYEVPDTYKTRVKQDKKDQDKQEVSNIMDTVAENRKGYTERQFLRAKTARKLYHNIGTPTVENFKKLLKSNMIKNCPVTIEDVNIAEKIFGPAISSLKGKSTRNKPMPVREDIIEIPRELIEKHENVDLCMDTMFINNEGMLTTIDKTIKFRSLVPINSKVHDEYYRALDVILRQYNKAGFRIKRIHCDGEYRAMMEEVEDNLDIEMNYANPKDHVPEAERNNRTIKERVRAAYHRLPYKKIPKIMIRYLAMTQVNQLNMFPVKGGISSYYSPRVIMGGTSLDYNKHCAVPFGAYVQANHEEKKTNTQAPRTIDCIYLRPSNNLQGGHDLMSLHTGALIQRRKVTEIPVTQVIIDAVERMATKEGFTSLKFKDRNKIVFFDTDWIAGVDYDEDENENQNEEDDEDYIDEDDEDIEYDEEVDQDEIDELNDKEEDTDPTASDINKDDDEDEDQDTDEENESKDDTDGDEIDADEADKNEEDEEEVHVSEPRRSTRAREPIVRLEPKLTGKSYFQKAQSDVKSGNEEGRTVFFQIKEQIMKKEQCHNLITQVHPNPEDDVEYSYQMAIMIARTMIELKNKITEKGASYAQQYLLKKGLKKFGDQGKVASTNEMDQLHKRNCFTPVSVKEMTTSERRKAVEALMFLTEKRDGRIKGRMVYNGAPTREWLSREEAASPTAAQESIFLTAVIEAHEGRDVMTADVPNAFIQAPLKSEEGKDKVIMKITGVLVDLLVDLAPETYSDFVVFENGRKVIYVQVLKAIYGMLQSALLWYKQFRKDLEEVGFVFNPYDPCVANRMINNKQQTICIHVDDVKSSHVNAKINDDFEKWLNDKYGEYTPVTTTRGKVHIYLGVTFDYSEPGVVKIDMVDYVRDMIDDFPERLKKSDTAITPASDSLFEEGKGKELTKEKADLFHRSVAKGLFICKRARPDIQQTIAVLCTRVKNPRESEWKKLSRLMKYLNGTQEMKLILSAECLHVIKWYVDASFAVHPDFKSHTGGAMTFGRGAVQSNSRKQKLNTKSSTDAELVGADDMSVMILWTKLFMEAQGYKIEKNILYQDNKSAILLEVNGRESAGKRSRALNVRYFFLTDQVARGNLTIEYCPTGQMMADYHTKPLQGKKFQEFRDAIMGRNHKSLKR